MKYAGVVVLALVLCFVGITFGQITLQFEDFPYEEGAILTRGYGDNLIPPGLAGEDMSWDYSAQPTGNDVIETLVDPEGQPGADTFPDATLAMTYEYDGEVGQLVYFREVNNNIEMLGFVLISGETPYAVPIDINGPRLQLPISYGNSWDFVTTTDFDGDIHVDSTRFIADAWGTMIDAAGTFNCLRLRMNNTHTVLPENTVSTKISYMWIAENWGELCLIESQDDEIDPDFDNGDYELISNIEGWVGVRETDPEVVRSFILQPAYPNPFNASTTIKFTLANPSDISLALLNTLGQQVAVVTNGSFATGTHQFALDGAGLASGTYFVRLAASGQQTQLQRITLVK